ncbi:MAG: twin-arginine translocase subunit TatB [Deltaproteobacteria bacterium]|nr:twin-arginine translocase subunit TatB [Deltaproteobacteria bacterium]MBW2068401.1 twin-arginine translocase subunit TatB [Deltaproteobacteria bacterium]
MFNLGFQELLVILIVAVIVVGPKNLPNVARALGKAYAEFRRAMRDLQETVESTDVVKEFKEEVNRVQHGIRKLPHELQQPEREQNSSAKTER